MYGYGTLCRRCMYSVHKGQHACSYKLVELPDDLVRHIKQGGDLEFKSSLDRSDLVLCTNSSTYRVRQANHSNTVLLLSQKDTELTSVAQSTFHYELTHTDGAVDTTSVPVYSGDFVNLSKSVAQVCSDSPIAGQLFTQKWHSQCGSEVNGAAVILSPAFVTSCLYTLISTLLASKATAGFSRDTVAKCLPAAILDTILDRFCEERDGAFAMRDDAVVRWFGVETLKACEALTEREFLLKWKSSLPPFFTARLDLSLLRGFYCRPDRTRVRYLNPESLSNDLSARIKEMFQLVPEWTFDEFLPFVQRFVPESKKPEAFLLKFVRKKRANKTITVGPR